MDGEEIFGWNNYNNKKWEWEILDFYEAKTSIWQSTACPFLAHLFVDMQAFWPPCLPVSSHPHFKLIIQLTFPSPFPLNCLVGL